MLKYDNFKVTFSEVPDEVSLYITITNCPNKCPLCNSKFLWEDTGEPLLWETLSTLISNHSGITCICFGGGDAEPKEINRLALHIRKNTNLKICWYSGKTSISKDIDIANFDYIKIGPFNGIPLNEKETNQIMYKVHHLINGGFELINITYKFQNDES